MGRLPRYTDKALIAAALADYTAGAGLATVARRYGVSTTTVRRWCKSHGVAPHHTGRPRRLTWKDFVRLGAWWAAGVPFAAIGARLGITAGTVKQYALQSGLRDARYRDKKSARRL